MEVQKIVPALWFDKDTEEAINLYVSVFNDSPHKRHASKIISIARYEKGMDVPGADQMEGKILTAIFELNVRDSWLWMGDPSSNSTKLCRSMWSAKTKTRSITFGADFQRSRKPNNVAGSKTGSASPGKLSPSNSASSSAAPLGTKPWPLPMRC